MGNKSTKLIGISQINYQMPFINKAGEIIPNQYKEKIGIKTIYDPQIWSDDKILALIQEAVAKEYKNALIQGQREYQSNAGGLNFIIYLDKNNEVINVFPQGYKYESNMNTEDNLLFQPPLTVINTENILKRFFNLIYMNDQFLLAIDYITKKVGLDVNGVNCTFPDLEDWNEELHFEGVWFTLGDHEGADELIVSEQTCFDSLRIACEHYIKKHPEDRQLINKYLSRASLPVI